MRHSKDEDNVFLVPRDVNTVTLFYRYKTDCKLNHLPDQERKEATIDILLAVNRASLSSLETQIHKNVLKLSYKSLCAMILINCEDSPELSLCYVSSVSVVEISERG